MRGQLLSQETNFALLAFQLSAQLLRRVLVTPPDRKDNNPQNYNKQNFHKDGWLELYSVLFSKLSRLQIDLRMNEEFASWSGFCFV